MEQDVFQSSLQSDSSDDSTNVLGTDYQQNDLVRAVKGRSRVSRDPYNIAQPVKLKKKKLNKQEQKEDFVERAHKEIGTKYKNLLTKDIIGFIYDNTLGLIKYANITRNKTFYIDYIKLFGENTEQLVMTMKLGYSLEAIKELFTNYLELQDRKSVV